MDCGMDIEPTDWLSASVLYFISTVLELSSVEGPCECGRTFEGDVVTVTPPEVTGMPCLLCPVMITSLLKGGTGVTGGLPGVVGVLGVAPVCTTTLPLELPPGC